MIDYYPHNIPLVIQGLPSCGLWQTADEVAVFPWWYISYF